MGTAIVGLGAFLPKERVTNDDLVRRGVNTTDEWISARTGISSRYWAGKDEATSDLALAAGRMALEDAGASINDVRLIICATSSPDHPIPATASLVQSRLGCRGAGAFDLNAVCSGFVHAVCAGFALCEQQRDGLVLVIGADTYSRWLDLRDRQTSIFFGDGAGAIVLAPSDRPSWLLASEHGSDGANADKIMVKMGGSRCPTTTQGLTDGQASLHMDGKAVWNFAVSHVPNLVRRVVEKSGLTLSQLDLVIPHQANARLLETCADELGIERRRMFMNLRDQGNTAAASIPMALEQARREGQVTAGSHLVLVGFGGGLAWSAACLKWGDGG